MDKQKITEQHALKNYREERYQLNWNLGLDEFNSEQHLVLLETFAARWGPMTEPDILKRISRIKQYKLRSMLVPFGIDWAKK